MILKHLLGITLLVASAQSQVSPIFQLNNLDGNKINVKRPRHIGGGRHRYVTETVYGFLDFTTTVGSTVMVFTPQSEIGTYIEPAATLTESEIAVATIAQHIPIARGISSEKNRRRTKAPTGLAKLLQEALLLKHSSAQRKSEKETTAAPLSHTTPTERTPPLLEPSIYVPEEVVISAGQQLPSISVLGPFNTKISNNLNNDLRYNFAISEPRPSANADYALVDIESDKPIGLVTTLGGTRIADGQTTIHKTSVFGTYVGGQYAQILKSTSRIFNSSPVQSILVSPTPVYETVKAVISGSATQFFFPDGSDAPHKKLHSSAIVSDARKPRYEANYYDGDYYADESQKDLYYYDEYDDLQKAGSGPRASFKSSVAYISYIQPTHTQERAQPSTFRHRYKSGSTRNTPPSFRRNSPPSEKFQRDRFRLSTSRIKPKQTKNNPKLQLKNRFVTETRQSPGQVVLKVKPVVPRGETEETVRIVTSRPVDGTPSTWYEIFILKSLHTYRIGATKNTRYLTYTRTKTHTIQPTSQQLKYNTPKQTIYDKPLLFENVLDENKEIATLPMVNIEGQDLYTLLHITTETFKTVETMYKTSVLPVQESSLINYYTLTQTYYITRMVTAIKTVPPFEQFIPSNSLNEFNDKLLAEGTENEDSLLPGEKEYDENGEIRVRPPPGFKVPDANLLELAGGKFNPDVLEKQMNPQLAAAIQNYKSLTESTPGLAGTIIEPLTPSPVTATPALSPQALQMAYLRLMNPYMFGGLNEALQATVTSSPVIYTTDVTTTETRVLRVIFNARPIMTTITNTAVVRTTLTSYTTVTVPPPTLPGFGGLNFQNGPFPFPAG